MTQEKSGFNQPAGAGAKLGSAGLPATTPSLRPSAGPGEASQQSQPVIQGVFQRSNPPSSKAGAAVTFDESGVHEELRRLKRALLALSACNQAVAQAGSEQELLRQICDLMVQMGGYQMAGIAYAERDEEKTIRPMAYAGQGSEYLRDIRLSWANTPAGQGPAGTAIRENRICVIADTANDPTFAPWREAALKRGYAAVIALPLRAAGAAFGVLAIYSHQVGSFESSEVELLTEMANNLAYGIAALRSREETRQATAALQQTEAQYRQLVEQVPAISYLSEAGALGSFLYLSPQAERIFGYKVEDCLSDPRFWWDHLNPEDHQIATTEDYWEEGRPFQMEYRMRRPDGTEVWIRDEGLIFRDPISNGRRTRGVMIDITERKLAEEALRRSEENYRMFVAQSSEGIFRLEYDPPIACDLPVEEQVRQAMENGTITECNDAVARMSGRQSAAGLVGLRLSEFRPANDPIRLKFIEDFIRGGYRIADRQSHESKGGRIFRDTMMGTVIDGQWVRTWGISRDVTDQVQLEEQLRNAQQLEAIGRLAGGVAHDFNNILSIIMGHGELLMAEVGGDERGRNGLEQIRRAAERAASLTQQLLAFSRKQVLQPKVLDLNEAVSDVQKMLSRVIGEDIELVASLHPPQVAVKADPGQVEQVLMNLAINARDAMPQGGKLVMETSNVEVTDETARDLELNPGRYALLKIKDTGCGMDATVRSHVFEPFFTTKPIGKGTGLGLATVYGIVKQSGGSIQLKSEVGRGTEFHIYLPATEDSTVKRREASAGNVAGGNETVLLTEDEPDLRELARIFLEGYGYKVLEASSAEQALEMADIFTEKIDLLLTDVIMPGMSGRQLAESILTKRPNIRVVYMTGYTDDMVVQHKVLEPGVNLLQKPFGRSDLALKVRSTLDGK